MKPNAACPDCLDVESLSLNRRQFVKAVGVSAAASAISLPSVSVANEGTKQPKPEKLVKKLYESLTPDQKKVICFDWNFIEQGEKGRGLLRTHVSNNWRITKPAISSDFYTQDQQDLMEAIFFGLYNPDWRDRILTQLKDDAGGYGKRQSIAIFGTPGSGKFEFVMTGRHLTLRCDGDSAEHVAFGGPIFYGHAARGFHEKADHPGNVFWPQALKANKLYQMLDGKQRTLAAVSESPSESAVGFRGQDGRFPGIPISELLGDQKEQVQKVLKSLVEPYRTSDRTEVLRCLEAQGGLDKCSIAFYTDQDIGKDSVWDVWRLEGPSFVWHFRGSPHVHVWANVANDASVKTNAVG